MPKLPVITPAKFIRALQVLGFFRVRQKGSHLVMAHADGKRVVVPLHSKDIPPGTLTGMLKDIEISKDTLVKLTHKKWKVLRSLKDLR